MIDAGHIHLADLGGEQRMLVLVVSNGRFTRLAERVIVAPVIPGEPDDVPFPWRVESGGYVFAVDLLRSVPADRLLDRVGQVEPTVIAAVQRTIRHIT